MGYGLKLVGLSTCFTLMFISGVLLFTRGFLLKRLVIDDKTSCNEDIRGNSELPLATFSKESSSGCWVKTKFQKAVILIIDALRYDFAYFNETIQDEDTLPYQNKLPVIHEVLKTMPNRAALYRFIADPPTTTMQRIKGLTTGSLPTFVDAGSNFASYSIKEDNIISKLVENGKNITFMGDETWEGLFPDTFQKSIPFPSFNVKDLHTVDNGVIENLVPEIQQKNWNVLIGHFLGVDHCGHRYGPYHPAMAEKLLQMNDMLRSVMDVLDDTTVLFVMGDHGMTRTGDHGGDSHDELDAALFVYSKVPFVDAWQTKISQNPAKSVSQVDFVPTFSLMMGIPIPFGNLGTAITELFDRQDYQPSFPDYILDEEKELWKSLVTRIQILQVNAYQVNKYLLKYQEISDEIPKKKLSLITSKFNDVSELWNEAQEAISLNDSKTRSLSVERLLLIEQKYLRYLSKAKELCIGMWAKFDLILITGGIALQFCALLIMTLMSSTLSLLRKNASMMLKTALILTVIGTCCCIVLNQGDPSTVIYNSLVCCFGSLAFVFVYFIITERVKFYLKVKQICRGLSLEDIFSTIICILYFLSTFSNSFVVHEDTSVTFLTSSLLTVLIVLALLKTRTPQTVVRIFRRNTIGMNKRVKKETQKFDNWNFLTSSSCQLAMALTLFVLCGRLSSVFRKCREEQVSCESSSFFQPLSALKDTDDGIHQRFLLSSICACAIPLALRQWLRYQGNLNGSSPAVICIKYGLLFATAFTCAHWALQIIPQPTINAFPNLQLWQQIILPEFVYWLCLLTIILLLWQPLCLYTLLRNGQSSLKDSISSYLSEDHVDPKAFQVVFNELRKQLDSNSSQSKGDKSVIDPEENKPPVVYGLGTVYSSPILIIVTCFAMVLVVILSDGMVGSVLLLLAQMILFLEIHASISYITHKENRPLQEGPPWYAVVVWGLLSSQYFFSTGHQATIPAIRFEAAFVGLPGDMNNNVLPGLLIFMNTFASSILFAVGLPVLLLWPRISITLLSKARKSQEKSASDQGEFVFLDNRDAFREDVFRLITMYQVFHGFKVLFCACSAAMHRRHLMVWKVFAPRFVFEGASFFVNFPFLVFIFLVVLRIDDALVKWADKLEAYFTYKDKSG